MSKLVFDEANHTYTIGGVRLPSVTQVLRSVFPAFQADEYYLQRGRALHHATVLLDQGLLDWSTVDEAILGRTKAWEKFRRDFKAEIVSMEKPLASERYRFAGCHDRLMFANRIYIMADLKSSVEPIVIPQLGAYSILNTENGGSQCKQAVAIELRENETYSCKWLSASELKRAEQVFIAALTCYGFMKSNGLTWRKD